MATQSKTTQSNKSITDKFEGAAGRIEEINERTAERGRKASVAYLNTYEKAVVSLADLYEKGVGATRIDWLTNVAAKQAKATRDMTKTYASVGRDLVA
jgi:hypothetical protein